MQRNNKQILANDAISRPGPFGDIAKCQFLNIYSNVDVDMIRRMGFRRFPSDGAGESPIYRLLDVVGRRPFLKTLVEAERSICMNAFSGTPMLRLAGEMIVGETFTRVDWLVCPVLVGPRAPRWDEN